MPRRILVLFLLTVITAPLSLSDRPAHAGLIPSFNLNPALVPTAPVTGSGCLSSLNPPLHLTLLVPTSNPARRASAAIVQNDLQCLGMNVSRVELPFSPNIYDRALAPPASNLGKTFDQGGFDILFVGYNIGIEPDPYSLYSSTQFAPDGSNYYLWNNTQNDNLDRLIQTTMDPTVRDNYVKQWQVLAYNELPSIPMYYNQGIVAFYSKYPDAQAIFSVYHYPAWPPVEHLDGASNSTFILAETGQAPGQGVIPELSTSYYDLALSGEIFSPLALRNDTIFKTMIPDLAAGTPTAPGWSVTSDNKTWTVNIRTGVTWQDGQPFTADDVKFTFDLYQNDTFGSPTESFVKGIVGGIKNVTETSPTQVVFHLPVPYAYFVQNILSTPILPKHILSAFSKDYSKIANSLFNRPDTGSNAVSSSLPVGTGPYKYVSYDSATPTNYLVRNDNYFNFNDWGKAALQARGQFQVKNYYVRTIIGGDQAIAALTSGEVDYLDGQYHLETKPAFLNSWGSNRIAVYDDYGVQEIGVNMEHPILGNGLATPLGQQDRSKAALAARYVRQAISYAVPRDQLISQLLNGYGVPAITTPIIGDYRTGLALTEGFNTALTPYPFNLTRARELLQLAGYQPPPTVTITSVSPNPASTGEPVTVEFSVSSAVAVSSIHVDWGDGTITSPDASATSSSHIYTSAESSISHTYTINVTAASGAAKGWAATTVVIEDRPPILSITSLSPNPANPGTSVKLNFTALDPDGSVTATWIDWGDGSKPDLIVNMTSESMCQKLNPSLNSNSCTIAPGDLILAQSQDPSTIVYGSIIIVRPVPQYPDFLVVHRVIKIIVQTNSAGSQYTFWTEGDANLVPDPWAIPASQVVAVYQSTLAQPEGGPGARYDKHTYSSLDNSPSRTYQIQVNATDDSGSHSYLSTIQTINDLPPIATIENVSPAQIFTGTTVTLNISATDPDGTISSISIYWGDGITNNDLPGSTKSSAHTYNTAGTFTISVRTTDNSGSTGQPATQKVTVNTQSVSNKPIATILGLSPLVFYGIVWAVIIALAATIIALAMRTRRRVAKL